MICNFSARKYRLKNSEFTQNKKKSFFFHLFSIDNLNFYAV